MARAIQKLLKYLIQCMALLMFYFIVFDQTSKKSDYNPINTDANNLEGDKIQNQFAIKNKELNGKRFNDIYKNILNSSSRKDHKYIIDMSSPNRLNKLFDIIHEKERKIELALRNLELLVFEDLISDNQLALPPSFKDFNSEIKDFLQVVDKKVQATPKFMQYLNFQSDLHTFQNPRKNILKRKIIDVSI
jgi:hypothetical protein